MSYVTDLVSRAELGDVEAQYELGYKLLSHQDFNGEWYIRAYNEQEQKGEYWLTKAAERGHKDAIIKLSSYYIGKGDVRKEQYWKGRFMQVSTNSSSGGGGGGCYVATCVYGSYDCPEVWTLRRFRDNILSDSWFGRRFIQAYYAVGPKAVELFGSKKWFNRLWKSVLDRFVCKLQKSGIDSSPYSDIHPKTEETLK
jgi:hypothetical protein